MDILKFINEQMDIIAVPYEFGEWTSAVTYPYFVGEMPSPEEMLTEDGAETAELLVTGFHRGDSITLVEYKEKIKKHFHPVHGLRAQIGSGAIAVFYEGAFYIPTNEAGLKRIQISLRIKSWKGDL